MQVLAVLGKVTFSVMQESLWRSKGPPGARLLRSPEL